MRLATALQTLLSQELVSREATQRVTVTRIQATPWDWVLFWITPTAERSLRTLLSILVPFHPGEMVLAVDGSTAFYSTRDILVDAVPQKDRVVRQALQDSPPEVQLALELARGGHRGAVVFARVQRDKYLSDVNSLLQVVKEHTWFGFRSLPAVLQKRHIDITLGAQHARVETLRNIPLAAAETDEAHISIFPTSPSTAVTIRILSPSGATTTDRLPAARVANALGIPLRTYYGFAVSLPVEIELLSRTSQQSRNDVIETLESCTAALRTARVHCQSSIERGIDETIQLLEARRRRTRSRKMIRLIREGNPPRVVGVVPTNEHEVLILAGKLEAYICQVIPLFRIREHTSQVGIDALADVQLSKDSAPARDATLEFEFELSNFFKHSHPIRQTEFIVCWSNGTLENGKHTYGDGNVDRRGELSFEMRGLDWIRFLNFGDHLIRVLLLQNLPGLQVQDPQDYGM